MHPNVFMHATKLAAVALFATALPSVSVAEPADVSPAQAEQGAACDAWRIEYVTNVNLSISDTPMGAGDGVYKVGPGTVVLRFENKNGQPGGRVDMLQYRSREYFTVVSRALFWTTKVKTHTTTRATPDACGVIASGNLQSNTLSWSSPVRGCRTDGTLECDGSLCGKFGAPPAGVSDLHVAAHPVSFKPFRFGKDLKTFKMAFAFAAHTDAPKQTSHIALSGREISRTCVAAPTCR